MARVVKLYPQRDLPSVPAQVVTLSKAVAALAKAVVTGQPVLAPPEVQAQREQLCRSCPEFRTHDQRCSLCGCCTSGLVLNKLKYASQRCPAKPSRWEAWQKE